jgi:ABC-2 type transport system permease protein
MNARILATIIAKDLTLYFRNRFFAFVTILGLVVYLALYWLMPADLDERLNLGLYAPNIPRVVLDFLGSEELRLLSLDSEEALQDAVKSGELVAGIVLTNDAINGIMRGQASTVTAYFASDMDADMVNAVRTLLSLAFNELSDSLNAKPSALEWHEEIVGVDMTGQALALRERMVPLLAVMLLIIEMMGLGSLISEEVSAGTLRALLITPVTLTGIFMGKAVVGVLLAFVQAGALMALTGNLSHEPILLLITLLLGGLLATGLAFLVASVSHDMMSVMGWSLMLIIILLVPAFGVVFPGTVTPWVRLIPSYYLFDIIHQVVNLNASWGETSQQLVVLLAMGLTFLAAGVWVMGRKLR